MTTKEQIIQELEQVPEPLLTEVLDFLKVLKEKRLQEDLEDLEDARAALREIETEGTVSWKALKAELGL